MADTEIVPGFNRLQFSQMFDNGGMMVIRADSMDEFNPLYKEFVEAYGEIAAGVATMQAAGAITGAKDSTPKTNQSRNSGARTVSPSDRKASSSGGQVCDHGEPWKDLDGKTTKAGAAYKFRFYNSCGNSECKPWGNPS